MASQLILIKSRRLLPTVSEDYEVETQDLEDALIDQIEEYRRYKEASEQLSALHQARATHYSHEKIEIIDDEVNLRKDKTAIDLFLAFSRVLEQKQQHFKDTHTTIAGDNYSIEDKMVEIRHLIRERKHLTISALFAQATSLDEMISDFLALLELVKTNVLTISQDEAFDEVYLDVREDRIEEDVTPV
jgi:segregation and condensation protein A